MALDWFDMTQESKLVHEWKRIQESKTVHESKWSKMLKITEKFEVDSGVKMSP